MDYTQFPTKGREDIKENQILANRTSSNQDSIYRGIGAEINPGMTIDEQLEAASLNWEVATTDVSFGDNIQYKSDYRKALFRADTGQLLDTVGKNWQPFQNREIVTTFNQFLEESKLEIEHLGSLDQGRTIFATAKLNDEFALSQEDLVEGRLLLTNYHKQGRGLKVDLMTRRLVCSNGMTVPVRVGGRTITHVSNFDSDRVLQTLESAKTNFQQFREVSEQLTQIPMSVEEATLILIKQFGEANKPVEKQPKIVQTCLKLFKGAGKGADLLSAYHTAWGLLQSVTEFYNHHSMKRGSIATHLNSLWLGNKAQKQSGFMQTLQRVCLH